MSSTDGKKEDALKTTRKDSGMDLHPYKNPFLKRLLQGLFRSSPLA